MQNWDYLFVNMRTGSGGRQVIVDASDRRLNGTIDDTTIGDVVNRLGAEGWEMVNCQGIGAQGHASFFPERGMSAVFKRPKE